MGRGTKPSPRTNLSDDINKLIAPATSKKNQALQPRQARASIDQQQGSGREGVAQGDGNGEVTQEEGSLISSDGMFVIEYNYHTHGL